MPIITLPNQEQRQYEGAVTGLSIAEEISAMLTNEGDFK